MESIIVHLNCGATPYDERDGLDCDQLSAAIVG